MLKRGTLVADPLDPKNWEAYSPKSSDEGERRDAFTSLNADDEYFRRTGGTKPLPPPKEITRVVENTRLGKATLKQEVLDSSNFSNSEKHSMATVETISQRTIRYPEQDMIAAQMNIPNRVSSPPRPSSLEKGCMKPTTSFMKLSIEENPTPQTTLHHYGDQGNIAKSMSLSWLAYQREVKRTWRNVCVSIFDSFTARIRKCSTWGVQTQSIRRWEKDTRFSILSTKERGLSTSGDEGYD